MSQTMRAVVIRAPGGPEVLEVREVARPEPQRGEARVRVVATAVNRADLLQRLGLYPAPPDAPADIPGLEFAGVVDAVGEGVREVAVGERVFGLTGGGAYAQYVVVHARTLAKTPASLGDEEAAAVPEAFLTAYDAMVTQAKLSAGETVLVSAVGSGVGTAAVQLAKVIGARSIGTARTAQKLGDAYRLGMDEGVVPEEGAFAAAVLGLTQGRGVDVVLELAGGGYVAEDLRCTAPGGRIVVVGLMAGSTASLDLRTLLGKRLELRGTVMRARPLEEKIALATVLSRHLSPLFERGLLKPVVGRVFPLAEAAAAHAFVGASQSFGKVVLRVA